MKITIPMIIDRLSGDIKTYINEDGTDSISNVNILDEKLQNIKPNILYITTYSFLLQSYKGIMPVNLLIINDTQEEFICEKFLLSNIILIDYPVQIVEIFELIQNVIVYFNRLSSIMIRVLSENRGLQYLIGRIYEVIGNPISISNLSFKILAITDFKDTKSDIWEKHYKLTTENGYISNEHTKFHTIKELVNKMKTSDKPVFFKVVDDIAKPFICINLKQKNHNIGFFTIFETEKPFTKASFDFMEYFSEIISIELQKNNDIHSDEQMKYGYLIEDLLNGKQMSHGEIRKILKYFNFSISKLYSVMVLKTVEVGSYSSELIYLRLKLLNIVKCNACIIYRNCIIAILVAPFERECKEETISEFNEFLINAKLFAGISRDLSDLSLIKRGYDEAINAVEIGMKLSSDTFYFKYCDMQFYHLMDLCSKQEDVKNLCHPALHRLIEYDKNKKTEMTNTLYCYIKNGRSKSHTAEELHLQRSSLHYRIGKIEEIMGIQLDDYQSYFHIELSFQILRYVDAIK